MVGEGSDAKGYFHSLPWSQELNSVLEELILTAKPQSQSQWLGIPPSKTIIACICLFEIIPIYGLLGYIPAVRRFGAFGLQVCMFWEGFIALVVLRSLVLQ